MNKQGLAGVESAAEHVRNALQILAADYFPTGDSVRALRIRLTKVLAILEQPLDAGTGLGSVPYRGDLGDEQPRVAGGAADATVL